jgi:hypothetical protein
MPTYADFGGRVISTFAGWVVVAADTTPSALWTNPGNQATCTYAAICCHLFKPRNQTDDIFLAQILGHKLLGPNASLRFNCKAFLHFNCAARGAPSWAAERFKCK